MRVILLSLCVLFSVLTTEYSEAQAGVAVRRIALSAGLDFEPSGAACVLHVDGQVQLVRGLVIPEDLSAPSVVMHEPERRQRNWLICCAVPEGVAATGEVSAIIEQKGASAVVRSLAAENFFEFEGMLDSEEKSRQHLLKQREILASYQVQLNAQNQALTRLRSDADLIGQQGALSAREHALAVDQEQLSALNRERLNLEASIRQIRVQPVPANGATVEVELTRQVAELAQAARLAESTERERQSAGEGDLGEKMRQIEESRFDDIDLIRADLIKLRRRHQELEESLQSAGTAVLDYE